MLNQFADNKLRDPAGKQDEITLKSSVEHPHRRATEHSENHTALSEFSTSITALLFLSLLLEPCFFSIISGYSLQRVLLNKLPHVCTRLAVIQEY